MYILVVDRSRLAGEIVSAALCYADGSVQADSVHRLQDAIQYLTHSPYNLVLLNTNLAQDILVLCELVRAQQLGARFIIFGQIETDIELMHYVEAGVLGYVQSNRGLPALIKVLQAVERKEAVLPETVTIQLMQRLEHINRSSTSDSQKNVRALHHLLTPREQEVLLLIADRLTNQQLADKLGIELGTVKNHVHKILKKLNVTSRHEAAKIVSSAPRIDSLSDSTR